MGTNFQYIKVPANSVNVGLLMEELEVVTERCACGSAFYPGKWHQNSTVFTDDFRNWLASFDCEILKAEGFRVYPHTALAWHNDTNDGSTSDDLSLNVTTKINFMWGDLANCFMEYGSIVNESARTIKTNRRGRRAYVYDPDLMIVNERFALDTTILINRGPTHRVSNESDQDWLCLSCIIKSKSTGEPLLYEDAVNIFRSVCVS